MPAYIYSNQKFDVRGKIFKIKKIIIRYFNSNVDYQYIK